MRYLRSLGNAALMLTSTIVSPNIVAEVEGFGSSLFRLSNRNKIFGAHAVRQINISTISPNEVLNKYYCC